MPYISKSIDVNSIASLTVSPTIRADFVKRSVTSMCEYYGIKEVDIKSSKIPLRY